MANDDTPPLFDVFVSYARSDSVTAKALVGALHDSGRRVWFDETGIETFESITRGIVNGLANAKVLVAIYSEIYPSRRACQWELTAAFIAAQHEGDPRRRIFVINVEDGDDHVYPVELRDALFCKLAGGRDAAAIAVVADRVRAASDRLATPLGSVQPLVPPSWTPERSVGSNRFLGRAHDFWRLHSTLFADDLAGLVNPAAHGLAQVRGLGGVGKSLFVKEYALRFGAAYPGGVFVLIGADKRRFQLSTPAEEEKVAHAAKSDKPYLWIVDDLPSDLGDEWQRWLAPGGRGKTVITTRSRDYGSAGGVVDLDVLAPDEGYDLLTARRRPKGPREEVAAREIIAELGGHALAIDVTGGALAKLPRQTMDGFLAELRASDDTLDAAAAELRPELPSGHERSITNTLRRSIDLLDDAGRDFLRLASVLAPVAIPADLVDTVFAELGPQSR